MVCPAGTAGPQGPVGPAGPQGAAGASIAGFALNATSGVDAAGNPIPIFPPNSLAIPLGGGSYLPVQIVNQGTVAAAVAAPEDLTLPNGIAAPWHPWGYVVENVGGSAMWLPVQ